MSYEAQAQKFQESAWVLVSQSSVPRLRVKEVVRGIKCVSDEHIVDSQVFLDDRISSPDGIVVPDARSTITNPMVRTAGKPNGTAIPGVFRLASNVWSEKYSGYLQTLRLGWATALDWSEGHIIGGVSPDADRETYVVQFRNVAQGSVKALVEGLLTPGYVEDPTVAGNVLTGYWQITAEPGQQDDGAATITVTLNKATLINAIEDLAALTPLRTGTRDVDHAFGYAGGYTAHDSKSNHDGILLAYPRIARASLSTLELISDAVWQATLGDATYEFVKRVVEEDPETRTLTLRVAYARVDRRNWTAGLAPDITEKVNPSTVREGQERTWLGLDKADAAAVLAAILPGGGSTVAGYNVDAVRYSDNDDGSLNWTQVLGKQVKGVHGSEIETAQTERIAPHSLAPGTMQRVRIVNENLATKAQAYPVISDGHDGFVLVDTAEDLQANGRWAVTYLYEMPVWTAWSAGLTPTKERTTHPLADDESRVRVWAGIRKLDMATAKAAANAGTNNCAVPTETPANWKIFDVDIDDNRDGSITITQTVGRVPNRLSASGSATVHGSTATAAQSASDAEVTPPVASGAGIGQRVTNRKGDFDKFQVESETELSGPAWRQTGVVRDDDQIREEATELENQVAPPAPASNQETVRWNRDRLGRFTANTSKRTYKSRDKTGLVIAKDQLSKVTLAISEGKDAAPADAADGETVQGIDWNEQGKWGNRRVKREGVARTKLGVIVAKVGHVQENVSFYDNQDAQPIAAPGQRIGSPKCDELGKWSFTLHESTLIAPATVQIETWGDPFWRDGNWVAFTTDGGGVGRRVMTQEIVRPKTTHKWQYFASEEAARAAANGLGANGVIGLTGSGSIPAAAWHQITFSINRLDDLGNVYCLETHDTEQVVIQVLTP